MRRARGAAALLALIAAAAPIGARDAAPGPFHGDWRMAAADDRADHGLMAITIRLGRRAHRGSGDYAMHQPMCSFLAGGAVRGDGECELTRGTFVRVQRTGRTLVLAFTPTADGAAHRMTLVRRGARLEGNYHADGLVRRVILEAAP